MPTFGRYAFIVPTTAETSLAAIRPLKLASSSGTFKASRLSQQMLLVNWVASSLPDQSNNNILIHTPLFFHSCVDICSSGKLYLSSSCIQYLVITSNLITLLSSNGDWKPKSEYVTFKIIWKRVVVGCCAARGELDALELIFTLSYYSSRELYSSCLQKNKDRVPTRVSTSGFSIGVFDVGGKRLFILSSVFELTFHSDPYIYLPTSLLWSANIRTSKSWLLMGTWGWRGHENYFWSLISYA